MIKGKYITSNQGKWSGKENFNSKERERIELKWNWVENNNRLLDMFEGELAEIRLEENNFEKIDLKIYCHLGIKRIANHSVNSVNWMVFLNESFYLFAKIYLNRRSHFVQDVQMRGKQQKNLSLSVYIWKVYIKRSRSVDKSKVRVRPKRMHFSFIL